MRRKHWWASFMSFLLLTLLSGRAADAQVTAGPYAPAGSPASPGASDPGGFPASYAPWPGMSPYENHYSRHYNENGLWNWDANNKPQRYFFTLESLVSRTKRPEENRVGSPGVPPLEDGFFRPINFGAFTSGIIGNVSINTGAVFQDRKPDPTAPGIRGTWGFSNPDGSGLEIAGFWSSDVNWLFRRGTDPLIDFDPTALRITAALPLDDGLGGSSVPYDKLFKISYDTETFGAEVTWLLTPKWDRRFFTVRPLWGFRYMFIRERFLFEGKDSGLAITFNPDGTPDLTVDPVFVVPAFHSNLQSAVRSHLAGPQIGLRYELGRDKLKIWGESIAGILANRESIELSGNGIGDGFNTNGPNFVQESPFSGSQVHTHVSPLLEQSVYLEMKVFGLIPILRKMHVLENAKLRAGYSITGVWEMSRPGSSFIWQGLPRHPRIQVQRADKWYIKSWHFGIYWNY